MNLKEPQKEKKAVKKITKERLKNIALYYLERYETSVQNLKNVLLRRVLRYAHQNPEFDKSAALKFIEDIVNDFQNLGYVSDERFCELKIRDYLLQGKSLRYIKQKLIMKGIEEKTIDGFIQSCDYNGKDAVLKFALKKHIGPYRQDEDERRAARQKDMACLLRAGFDYDDVCEVLNMKGNNV